MLCYRINKNTRYRFAILKKIYSIRDGVLCLKTGEQYEEII